MLNKTSFGSWITLGHPAIAEIMADAGFDWLCVDIEHSVIDYKDVQFIIATIQGKGKKAYVRVGGNNVRIIKRVLDAGADGIIIPNVKSKEEAVKAVEAIKYPPEGKRGVGLARAQDYGFGFEKYKEGKAKEILIIAQIEHIDAINDLDAILSVAGIDGTFIGPYDLSGSMGKPGNYNEPDVKKALEKYERIAQTYDKLIGFHVVQPDHQLILNKINKGYNFIAFGFDAFFLGTKCREQMRLLKENLI